MDNCKFCGDSMEPIYTAEYSYNLAYLKLCRNRIDLNKDKARRSSVFISYCPVCGRKLDEARKPQ